MKSSPRRTKILVERLELMLEWYKGMVDEGTGRLLYLCDPEPGLLTAGLFATSRRYGMWRS